MPPLLCTVAWCLQEPTRLLGGPGLAGGFVFPKIFASRAEAESEHMLSEFPRRHRWLQDVGATCGSMVRVWGWEQVGMGSREFVDMGVILAEMSAWVLTGNWFAPWDRRRGVAKRLLAECWAGSSGTRYVSMGLPSEAGGPTSWLCTGGRAPRFTQAQGSISQQRAGIFREAVVDGMMCCYHWDDRITGGMAATKRRFNRRGGVSADLKEARLPLQPTIRGQLRLVALTHYNQCPWSARDSSSPGWEASWSWGQWFRPPAGLVQVIPGASSPSPPTKLCLWWTSELRVALATSCHQIFQWPPIALWASLGHCIWSKSWLGWWRGGRGIWSTQCTGPSDCPFPTPPHPHCHRPHISILRLFLLCLIGQTNPLTKALLSSLSLSNILMKRFWGPREN